MKLFSLRQREPSLYDQMLHRIVGLVEQFRYSSYIKTVSGLIWEISLTTMFPGVSIIVSRQFDCTKSPGDYYTYKFKINGQYMITKHDPKFNDFLNQIADYLDVIEKEIIRNKTEALKKKTEIIDLALEHLTNREA